MASTRVASGLGLAGRSKPMWLSEICRKLSPAPCAFALPIKDEVGTPADIVHNTPVPAHSIHSSAPLRSTPKESALRPLSLAIINSCCNEMSSFRQPLRLLLSMKKTGEHLQIFRTSRIRDAHAARDHSKRNTFAAITE